MIQVMEEEVIQRNDAVGVLHEASIRLDGYGGVPKLTQTRQWNQGNTGVRQPSRRFAYRLGTTNKRGPCRAVQSSVGAEKLASGSLGDVKSLLRLPPGISVACNHHLALDLYVVWKYWDYPVVLDERDPLVVSWPE